MINKFEILNNYRTWILKFSGGLDSTLILYYMNKIRTSQELWLMTGVNNNESIYNGHVHDIINTLNVNNSYHLKYPQTHETGREKFEKDYKFYERIMPVFNQKDTIVVQGRTKNPPFSIKGEDEIRNGGSQEFEKIMGFSLYRPWANIDKKEIIKTYKEENIESLIELTRSCVSLDKLECGTCFWCKEREWGLSERS